MDLFIDIDDTLVSRAYSNVDLTKYQHVKVDDITYVLYPGCIEFLDVIYSIADVKIIFYSGGLKDRNEQLISELLKLTQHVKKDVINILSRDDLIHSTDHIQPLSTYNGINNFHGYYKKDLSKYCRNLNSTILIDDSTSYVYKNQEKNLLYINGNPLSFIMNDSHFIRDRNHLFKAIGILFTVLNMSTLENINIVDALSAVQYYDHHKRNFNYSKVGSVAEYYHLGREILRHYNATIDFDLDTNKHEPWIHNLIDDKLKTYVKK